MNGRTFRAPAYYVCALRVRAPARLRPEALRPEMTYDHEHHQVRTRVTLTGDTIATVSRTAESVALFASVTTQSSATTAIPQGSARCPQRDSNPCRRLERAVS
jgi:hypothetical protein